MSIKIKRSKNPKIAVQMGGLILCDYQLTLRQRQKDFWSKNDDNVKDRDPDKDLDSKPQSDLYSIKSALQNHNGNVLLRWHVDMASFDSSGSTYDVVITVVQDDNVTTIAHYKHSDSDAGLLTSTRSFTGIEIFKVS